MDFITVLLIAISFLLIFLILRSFEEAEKNDPLREERFKNEYDLIWGVFIIWLLLIGASFVVYSLIEFVALLLIEYFAANN